MNDNQSTIIELVKENIKDRPQDIAVFSETKSLSFEKFDLLSDKLACHLQTNYNIHQGDRVLCNFDRDIDSLICIFSLLKLGAIYVPIIPEFGEERVRYIEKLVEPRFLLNNCPKDEHIQHIDSQIINLKSILKQCSNSNKRDLTTNISDNQIVCILFTSGSTGKPKGVPLTHEGCVNRIAWMLQDQPYFMNEICIQNTRYTTVDSIWEMFAPLISKMQNKLLILPEPLMTDIRELIPKLDEHKVKRICLVPSLLTLILEIFPNLSKIAPQLDIWVTSGQILSKSVCLKFYKSHPKARLFNQYGLTETSADVSYYDTSQLFISGVPTDKFNFLEAIPIGIPISHTHFILKNNEGKYDESIYAGELCIYGKCIFPGYYKDTKQSAAKFGKYKDSIPIFHTGDYCIKDSEGTYNYLNRIDELINIKGYKIYPQEIEDFVQSIHIVHECKVIFNENIGQLCLYYTLAPNSKTNSSNSKVEIYNKCRHSLATYMIPKILILMDAFPSTPTGKIDPLSFPKPTEEDYINIPSEVPINELQKELSKIWQKVLNISTLSIKDSFYSVGGDSLKLVKLAIELQKSFSVKVSIDQLTRQDTIEKQEKLIKLTSIEKEPADVVSTSYEYLSDVQERLLFAENFSEEKGAFNLTHTYRIPQEVDINKLQSAVNTALEGIDILNYCFSADKKGQVKVGKFVRAAIDYKTYKTTEDSSSIIDILSNFAYLPFDLFNEPPFRVYIHDFGKDIKFLQFVAHHICCDGFSFTLLNKCISTIYSRSNHYKDIQNYSSFIARENEFIKSDTYQKQLHFWQSAFSSALNLPIKERRSIKSISIKAQHEQISLSIYETTLIEKLCSKYNITPTHFFISVYVLILSNLKISKSYIATVINKRDTFDVENVFGPAINNLALLIQMDNSNTFIGLCLSIKELLINVISNSDIPWGHLFKSDSTPSPNLANDFQFFFIHNDPSERQFVLDDVVFEHIKIPRQYVEYKMVWNLEKSPNFILDIEYQEKEFSSFLISELTSHISKIIQSVCKNPAIDIHKMFNVPELVNKPQLPNYSYLIETIIASLRAYGDKEAISFYGQSLSYSDLDLLSTRIAQNLIANGVKPGNKVAVCLPRSLELIAIFIGILKTGAAYVPIDIAFPPKRIQYIIEDAQSEFLIHQHETQGTNLNFKEGILLDASSLLHNTDSDSAPLPSVPGSAIAYLLYTSGSTGRPKGVMITHANLLNFLLDMKDRLNLDTHDRLLAITTVSFDISALELYLPLLVGATIDIINEEDAIDGFKLKMHLDNNGCTAMQTTPTRWNMLLESGWKRPTHFKVFSGGEALTDSTLNKLTQNGGTVWNLYGPTETTIWSTAIELKSGDKITLGCPISNTQVYILNDNLELMPPGSIGEICISGAGVGQGYYNKPELTAQAFIKNPYSSSGFELLYRTGDLGSYDDEGSIEYHGRKDSQIKLRGYRIEVGEIESCLMRHPDVEQAAVTQSKDTHLVAHIIPKKATSTKTPDFSLFFFSGLEKESQDNLYDLVLASSQYADEHGFKAVWTPERHFHQVGGAYPNPSLLGAAISAVTKKIDVRAGSVVLPLHDTIRVAEEWSAIHNLSKGRAGIALAAGWNARDFVFYPDKFATRYEYLENGIKELKDLWSGASIQRTNGLGQEQSIKIYPQPFKGKEIPLWITSSGGNSSFELAGRSGANLLTHLLNQDAKELEEKIKVYKSALEKHGHDPATRTITLMLHTFVRETNDEARSICRDHFREYLRSFLSLEALSLMANKKVEEIENHYEDILDIAVDRYIEEASLIGGIEECVGRLGNFLKMGITEIACLVDFGVPSQEILSGLDYIGKVKKASKDLVLLDKESIKKFLKSELPDYMVPHFYKEHTSFPETMNQKIDRKALADTIVEREEVASDHKAPETDLEKSLAKIWEDILETKIQSVNDDFFSLGGHSLLAARVINCIRDTYNINVPIRVLFEEPTLYAFAEAIQKRLAQATNQSNNPTINTLSDTLNTLIVSPIQKRMFFLSKISQEPTLYYTPIVIQIIGDLDINRLKMSIELLTQRHDILRTIYHHKSPFLSSHTSIDIEMYQDQSDFEHYIKNFLTNPFNLDREPLVRFSIVKAVKEHAYLIIKIHHAISDAWSIGIIKREIGEHYDHPDLVSINKPYQYQDYCKQSALEYKESDIDFWKIYLKNCPITSTIPSIYTRPPEISYKGDRVVLHLDLKRRSAIEDFCKKNKITPFVFFAAVLNTLIYRYSKQKDIVIGFPIQIRDTSKLEEVIGPLLNTIPLRSEISGEASFINHVSQIKNSFLDIFEYKNYPLEKLIETLEIERNLSFHPIFQVMLIILNANEGLLSLNGLQLEEKDYTYPTSKFDLSVSVDFVNTGLDIRFEYSTDLYPHWYIQNLMDSFSLIIEDVLKNEKKPISKINILSTHEEQQIINHFVNTELEFNQSETIIDLIDKTAVLNSNQTALRHNGESINYKNLVEISSQYAEKLASLGIGKGSRVAICLERNFELILSIIGVLRTGASYVPIDLNYPPERTKIILEQSNCSLILVQEKNLQTYNNLDQKCFAIEEFSKSIVSTQTPLKRCSSEDEAYLIYTSGSTGVPKGIRIQHKQVSSLLAWAVSEFDRAPLQGMLFSTSICFDLSIFEMFLPLVCGGSLIISNNALEFHILKDKQHICMINTVPSAMKIILSEGNLPKHISLVCLAGEALEPTLVNNIFQNSHVEEVYNLYGPSECTTYASFKKMHKPDSHVSIGIPVKNTRFYILDSTCNLLPRGVVGELYIAGCSVASGYVQEPRNSGFISLNIDDIKESHIYKTGDLVRINEFYELEYLGRADNQIKLRGYRIEIAEIETTLKNIESVEEAVVGIVSDMYDNKVLLAYIVSHHNILKNDIESILKHTLPSYMIPQDFRFIDKVPLTPNGKIDRKKLFSDNINYTKKVVQISDSSKYSDIIGSLWKQILKVDTLDKNKSFFELGADSLKVMEFVDSLAHELSIEIKIVDVFKYPSISSLSQFIEEKANVSKPTKVNNITKKTIKNFKVKSSRV